MALPDIQAIAADIETGEHGGAIPLLEQVIDTFPTYATAYLLLARAYRKQGNRDAALQALSQVQLWSAAPTAVHGELRAIIHDHLEAVYSSTESDASTDTQLDSPSIVEPATDVASGVRRSHGAKPEDLVEDLQERLGPPAIENDEDIKNLNSLIRRLEGARIQPEPEFGGANPADETAEQDDEEDDEVVSETLARIYAAQKEYRAAVETYQRLAEQHPDRAEEFHRKAQEMKQRLSA